MLKICKSFKKRSDVCKYWRENQINATSETFQHKSDINRISSSSLPWFFSKRGRIASFQSALSTSLLHSSVYVYMNQNNH